MIRQNRAYNDPNIAAAFGNLAGLFAPPSAQDLAGYATANAKNAESARLADLFAYAQGAGFDQATFDRMGQAAGQWNPSNGYYGVDTAAATARRGQDVTASTALATNRADNQRAAITSLYGPLSTGQVRPDVPEEIMAALGLPGIGAERGIVELAPGETAFMPGGETLAGTPKPLSETEQKAAERQSLIASGQLTDQYLLDMILGDKAPVEVQGEDGPRYMMPGEAARTGAAPVPSASSSGTPRNYVTPDGRRGTSLDGRTDAASGEPLPQGTQTFTTAAQGSAEDVGLGKTTNNRVEQQLIDLSVARNTARGLRELIASSPSSQGVVGWARGTAQNVIQTGGELGQYFGGGLQEVSEAINSGLADASLAGSFDPNIPAIEMMSNLLAFQYAKTTTGERLSNEMLRSAKAALGLEGMFTNQADATARLDTAIKLMDQQEALLLRARQGGVGALASPDAAQPAAPAAPAAQEADIPTVATPEEAMMLPAGTRFRDPDGNIRVRP